MKIQHLTVRNFKGARRIEIHAHPTCNELVGDNGAGKNSVLDAIVAALMGARGMEAAQAPLSVMFIRDGSLLDSSSFEMVRGLAEERGYQLWVETVGEGHTGDVIEIVEGETTAEVP